MKKIARVLSSTVLKLTLFWAAIAAAAIGTFGSPATIKQSLSDSNVYDGLVANVLDQSAKDSSEKPEDGLDINSSEIKQAAESALTPETLESSAEQIIDGIYRWLDGEVATPDFKVDLTDVKQRFIVAAGEAAEDHVAGLPVCTAAEVRTLANNIDAFSMTCRPRGFSAKAAGKQVSQDLAASEDFLEEPVISAATLPKNDNGQNVFEQINNAPDNFQRAKSLPVILLILSLLAGAAVFFLNDNRRNGTKRLSITLAGTGAILLAMTLLTRFIFDRLSGNDGVIGQSLDGNSLQASILDAVRSLSNAFNKTVLIYGLVYLLVGLATLVALKFWWKQPAEATAATKPATKKPIEKPKTK